MAKKIDIDQKTIVIPSMDIRTAIITLVGDSPLIMHKWTEKAKKEMLENHMKKAKTKAHDPKDPVREFIESMYWLNGEPEEKTEKGFVNAIQNGARFGFPSVAFKASAVAAGYRTGVTPNMVSMNAAFHIDGEFVEIIGTPQMREDMVTIGMGKPDIRYRGEFPDWKATFQVKYNNGAISIEQLVNLFNLGGFACGIGEWRVEKGGTFGMYHVG